MVLQRYFSILFFLVALSSSSFSALLPMQQDNEQSSSSNGFSIFSWFGSFFGSGISSNSNQGNMAIDTAQDELGINKSNKRKFDSHDTEDELVTKKHKPLDPGLKQALAELTIALNDALLGDMMHYDEQAYQKSILTLTTELLSSTAEEVKNITLFIKPLNSVQVQALLEDAKASIHEIKRQCSPSQKEQPANNQVPNNNSGSGKSDQKPSQLQDFLIPFAPTIVALNQAKVSQKEMGPLLLGLYKEGFKATDAPRLTQIVKDLGMYIHDYMKNIPSTCKTFMEWCHQPEPCKQPVFPLHHCLGEVGFDQKDIVTVIGLNYPTKVLAGLMKANFSHVSMNKNNPNRGLNNGLDHCFLNATFQVLSQLNPFMNALEQMYQNQKTNDLQNEILSFISSLRGNPCLVYNAETCAASVMREFLTKHSGEIFSGMKTGHQDAHEFFTALLDTLTGQDINLSNIFNVHLISQRTLNDNVYETLQKLDQNVEKQSNPKNESAQCLSLALKPSIELCLNDFFSSNQMIDRDGNHQPLSWHLNGNDTLHDKTIFGSTQLSLDMHKEMPEILALHLNRFEYDLKSQVRRKLYNPVKFELKLNHGGSRYNLVGMIVHSGTATSGHYWAYTKDRFCGEWYLFNDNRRFKVTPEIIGNIGAAGIETKQIIESIAPGKGATSIGTPYMLFYEKA